jgi:membrane fusion protein, multidrug efflux system
MERTNTTLNERNGHSSAVLDKELIVDLETLEARTKEKSALVETPETAKEETKKAVSKRKKPIALILAALGVGAIAAGGFGYHYWQYTSTHQETDNATVAGHINQVSSKIPGTVSQVLVSNLKRQRITPGMSAEVAVEVK